MVWRSTAATTTAATTKATMYLNCEFSVSIMLRTMLKVLKRGLVRFVSLWRPRSFERPQSSTDAIPHIGQVETIRTPFILNFTAIMSKRVWQYEQASHRSRLIAPPQVSKRTDNYRA